MAYSGLSMWREAKKDGLECIRLNKEFLKGYHRAANAMIQLVRVVCLSKRVERIRGGRGHSEPGPEVQLK